MSQVISAPHEGAIFDRVAKRVECWMGQPIAFGLALCSCILWAVTGPLFNYSIGWQLVINTATTIVTFLMVFLIQGTTNRSSAAFS
jgi:low affinity Fe/Cu permease